MLSILGNASEPANDTFSLDDLIDAKKLIDDIPKPPKIVVHNFTEQFRFPKSKKRRIREKWKKRARNWRGKPNQMFELSLPSMFGLPNQKSIIMSPDVKAKYDEIATKELESFPELKGFSSYL